MNVFAFQFVLVQKMLFTDGEGGEEREESINHVQFYNKTATLTQLEAFVGRLLPVATTPPPATLVGTIGIYGNESGGFEKQNTRCINLS